MELRKIVADRLVCLRCLELTALQSLPPFSTESFASKVDLNQYHEASAAGEHKVVVQAIRPRWLSTAIEVDGFVVAPDGTKRPLTEEEKWPYL